MMSRLRRTQFFVTLIIVVSAGSAPALDYEESSTGLGIPALEGGRTEVEMADVNDDGHIDLVSIGDHGSPYINTQEHGVMVWFGDGTGSWSVFQYGSFGYGGVAVGDVDGDGLMDVAYGMHHNYSGTDLGDQILEVALGDGTGTFWTPWDDGLAANGESWGMFGTDLADVDNDGDLDVGSVSFGCCAGLHVYLSQGDGTWVQSFGFLGGNSLMEIAFGEINGDGNADFVVGHQSGTVYLGDGQGGFSVADSGLPGGGSLGRRGPDLGDINADGRDDLSIATSDGGVQAWIFDGQAWSSSSTGLPVSGPYESTQLCDMDGDGLDDVCAFGDGTVSVWLGDGGGQWTLEASFDVGSPGNYQAFRVGGDADHNGLPDIVLVEESGSFPTYQNHLRFYEETSTPSDLTARVDFPRGGERWILGSVRLIRWSAGVPGMDKATIRVELSRSGPGGPWSLVADGLADNGQHQLIVPGPPSENCFVRVRAAAGADTAWAVSPHSFTIAPAEGSSVPNAADLDKELRILSLWPNPFSEDVHIIYQGSAGEEARLQIFDSLGRRLMSIHLPIMARSPGVFRWRASNADGADLAGGTYFLRLCTSEEQTTRKILLVP